MISSILNCDNNEYMAVCFLSHDGVFPVIPRSQDQLSTIASSTNVGELTLDQQDGDSQEGGRSCGRV